MKISLPIKFIVDNDYLHLFSKECSHFFKQLSDLKQKSHLQNNLLAIDNAIKTAKSIKTRVMKSFNDYVTGNVSSAISRINRIISNYSNIFVKNISSAYAFIGNYSLTNQFFGYGYATDTLTFVKGRIGEPYQSFDWKGLFHIPLNKREFVKSQRYSIPGIPCVYLAQNSYVAWKELGCPSFDKLSLSSFETKKLDMKVIDLTFPVQNIIECLESNDYEFIEFGLDDKAKSLFNTNVQWVNQLISTLPSWVLIMAVSFCYEGKNERNFKSEYVIPQLVMYTLTKNDCIGVTYRSNQIDNDKMFASNLAIPIIDFNKKEENSSFVKSYFYITTPVNFGYYNQVFHPHYANTIKTSPKKYSFFNALISGWKQATYDENIHYQDTPFYYIDEFVLMAAHNMLPSVRNIKRN